MRFWFSRRERKSEEPRPAREQVRKTGRARPRPRRPSGPPADDPIKNWESEEQSFLRQAGDPFLDG
jgi:hypothetical protein